MKVTVEIKVKSDMDFTIEDVHEAINCMVDCSTFQVTDNRELYVEVMDVSEKA